jgi:hypothetical protein
MPILLVFRFHRLYFYYRSRAGQRHPSQSTENNVRQIDQWNEIDRRNQRVLYPLNAKESYGAQNYYSSINYQKNKLSSRNFNLEPYHAVYRRRISSQRNNEHTFDDSELSFQNNRILLTSNNNNNSPFLYGNSIIKTNKADILNYLEQQANTLGSSNIYVNKDGVIITGYGPFWPRDFRILHPTPKLLSRELTPKEFYLIVTNSLLSSKSNHSNNKVKEKKKRKQNVFMQQIIFFYICL